MKLLKFYADWCKPCKVLEGILMSLKVEHSNINIEDNPEEAEKYNIQGLPTLVKLDNEGKEIGRIVGALPLPKIKEFCEE